MIRPLLIRSAPDNPPFPVDALALEEDTGLVLSADPTVRDPGESLSRTLSELQEQRLYKPGSVVVRDGSPRRFLAVVHDFDREPSWCEDWISMALERVFTLADEHGAQALALERVGCVHGQLQPTRFDALLNGALAARSSDLPERIWLIESRRWTDEPTR
ncbi:MAG: hypothetical protein R3200_09995 [Xanthomonadales bacterium]|nr:hypothetical protein [Xanthomonadales bacterium]